MVDQKQDGSEIKKDRPTSDINVKKLDGLKYVENKAGEGLRRQLSNRQAQMISIGPVSSWSC
jgi:amino acid permease